MNNPRLALEAIEYLVNKYRAQAEALEPAVAALRELVETGEFTEQRRQAVEAARPFLSPEALAAVGLAPSGAALPVPARSREPKPWLRRRAAEAVDFGLD